MTAAEETLPRVFHVPLEDSKAVITEVDDRLPWIEGMEKITGE